MVEEEDAVAKEEDKDAANKEEDDQRLSEGSKSTLPTTRKKQRPPRKWNVHECSGVSA